MVDFQSKDVMQFAVDMFPFSVMFYGNNTLPYQKFIFSPRCRPTSHRILLPAVDPHEPKHVVTSREKFAAGGWCVRSKRAGAGTVPGSTTVHGIGTRGIVCTECYFYFYFDEESMHIGVTTGRSTETSDWERWAGRQDASDIHVQEVLHAICEVVFEAKLQNGDCDRAVPRVHGAALDCG